MPITINEATKRITITQDYLTPVSGTLYELDTDQFRQDMNALMDDERHQWLPDYADRNAPYTVFGNTYQQKLEIINGFSVEFDDTPGPYSVNLSGSNNNIADIQNGILIQNDVQVIPNNSAGAVVVYAVETERVIQAVDDWGAINYSKP